jgi:hypothetical protein
MIWLVVAVFLPVAAGVGYCNDKDSSCAGWGKRGECAGNNSEVVKGKCPHTCGVCTIFCSDTEELCDGWRRDGECTKSPDFMSVKCPTSCGLCSPKCADTHANCNTWGQEGLCRERPDIMHLHCPVTCGVCEGKCKDTMNDCPGWAAKGECMKNPGHSLINCPLSCGTCAAGPCRDVNVTDCALWAIGGQCELRPEYMAKECPASCGICTNVCEDKDSDCHNWAMAGECTSNQEHMLTTCPQSCGICSRLEQFVRQTSDREHTWMPAGASRQLGIQPPWHRVQLPRPWQDAMARIQDGQPHGAIYNGNTDGEDEGDDEEETRRVIAAFCAALCSALLTTAATCAWRSYERAEASMSERAERPPVAHAVPPTGPVEGAVERSRGTTYVGRLVVAAAEVIAIPLRSVLRTKRAWRTTATTLATWDDRLIAFLLPRHFEQRETEQEAAEQVAVEQQAAAEQEGADIGAALADRSRSNEAARRASIVNFAYPSFESPGRFVCLETSVEEVVRTPSRVGGGARRHSERGAASSSRDGEANHGSREEAPRVRRMMRQRGMFTALEQTNRATGQLAVGGPGPTGVARAATGVAKAVTREARERPASQQPPPAVPAVSDNAERTAAIAQSLASQQTDAEQRADGASDELAGSTNLPRREVRVMSYAELSTATSNFAPTNIVGVGGFGCVYRSEPLFSPIAIQGWSLCAVKRLNAGNGRQGGGKEVVDAATLAEVKKSVIKEVDLLGRCSAHPNLLPLLGYSLEQSRPACLVFPLCQGGTLEDRLLKGSSAAQGRLASLGWAREPLPLAWRARMNILRGVARALVHLHAHQLLHGDVKPSNILLNAGDEARLADFGLAHMAKKREATSTGQSSFSAVKGTAEYLDPI